MKRFLLIFTLVTATFVFLGVVTDAHALDLGFETLKEGGKAAGFAEDTSETTFAETLGLVVQLALSFVGIIFISLTVYAGYLWMIARGDESRIDKSKEILRASVIGMIITVGAYSIASLIVPVIIQKTAGDNATTGDVGTLEVSE